MVRASCWLVVAGIFLSGCKGCQQPSEPPAGPRASVEAGASPASPRTDASAPTQPAVTPVASAETGAPAESPPVFTEGNLEFDLDGDGRRDSFQQGTVTLRRASGAQEDTISTCCGGNTDNIQWFGALRVNGRGLAALRAQGHETDHEPGQPTTSSTWFDYAIVAVNSAGHVYNAMDWRIDEGEPEYDDSSPGTLTARPDGSVVFTVHGIATVLRWEGENLVQGACAQRAEGAPTPALLTGCTGTPGASFHVRSLEAVEHRGGPEFPAGTTVRVLYPGTVTRGAARLHCAVVPSGRQSVTGWVFLLPTELSGCPSTP